VFALADQMPGRFCALILAAAFTGLRWGELIALRRRDLDMTQAVVRVARKFAQLACGQMVAGPTKSAAGLRTVALPELIVADLRTHLEPYVEKDQDAADLRRAKRRHPQARELAAVGEMVRRDQESGSTAGIPFSRSSAHR
jgi:integrase